MLTQTVGETVTSYEYNVVNLPKVKTDPLTKTETYSYYQNGLLSEKTDRNGVTTSYAYNHLGLVKTEDAGGEEAENEYDAENRVISKTQSGYGTIEYQYDIPTDDILDILHDLYNYDAELIEFIAPFYEGFTAETAAYPDGGFVLKTYDMAGRLKEVFKDGECEARYYYYKNGLLRGVDYSNGANANYSYYANGKLSKIKIYNNSGTLYNFTYEYDGAGNLISKTENGEYGYSYDAKNRLTAEQKDGALVNTYQYDDRDNRVKQNAADLSLFEAMSDTTYSYDNRNRLISLDDGETHTYAYNAENYRIQKDSVKYAYEYDKPIAEYDESGTTAFNLFGTNLICRITGGEKYYYHYNAHGDVIAVTDETGALAATYEYDAWGNITAETGDIDNPFRYAGYVYDEETKLYYLNARYYDPLTGRFLTEDTYLGERTDPLSLNLYAYVLGNPLRYFDPTGHGVDDKLREGILGYTKAITLLQIRLNGTGWSNAYLKNGGTPSKYLTKEGGLDTDGDFGDSTLNVVNFFKDNRYEGAIQNDTPETAGIVGETTWKYLDLPLAYLAPDSASVWKSYKRGNLRNQLYSALFNENGSPKNTMPIIAVDKPQANIVDPSLPPSAESTQELWPNTEEMQGEQYAMDMLDKLLMSGQDYGAISNISNFYFDFTYACEYANRVFSAESVSLLFKLPDLMMAYYGGGTSSVLKNIVKDGIIDSIGNETVSTVDTIMEHYNISTGEAGIKIELILQAIFGDAVNDNISNKITDFLSVASTPAGYAIMPYAKKGQVQSEFALVTVRTNYIAELRGIVNDISKNADISETKRNAALSFVNKVIDISNESYKVMSLDEIKSSNVK
jgi:RHS repeat-associated protein